MAIASPAGAPFSRRWRYRLSRAYEIAQNPFLDRETELWQFIGPEIDVRVGCVAGRHASVSELELLALTCFVAQLRAERIFEIGTFAGRTARAMAMNLPAHGHLYTLNIPEEERPALQQSEADTELVRQTAIGRCFHNTPEEGRITQLWSDSANFDPTPYESTMDMVFIDGAHSREYAANDTALARRLLKPSGGLIVWHDAPLYGVAPFLRKYIRQHAVPLRVVRRTTLGVVGYVGGRFVDPVNVLRQDRSTARAADAPCGERRARATSLS